MKSIHQIREEIESLPNEDLIAHLNYYRQNHLNILSIVPTESLNHFEAKARILSIYGRLLVNNGNYSEGYDILSKAKETFELDPFKSVNIDEDSTYRNLMLNLGMACYHTKRSEQAKSIFQKLIKLDPRNDNYQEWLAGISLKRLVNLDKYFFYAFLVWLIGDVLFEDLIDELFKDLYLYLGIVLLVISISVGLYKRHIRKKMKQNITTNAR